jgi:hypothetical protein
MRPTPSGGQHVRFAFTQAVRSCCRCAVTLTLFTGLTAGCQNGNPASRNRLPPEQELQPLGEETVTSNVDPRRMSRDQLEVSDGSKALNDIERNGVNYRE